MKRFMLAGLAAALASWIIVCACPPPDTAGGLEPVWGPQSRYAAIGGPSGLKFPTTAPEVPNRPPSRSGAPDLRLRGLAVADLDQVAKQIGAELEYRMIISDYRADKQEELNEQVAELRKEIERLKAQLKDETNPVKRADIQQNMRKAERRVAKVIVQARTELAAFDARIKQEFRKRIKPAVQAVCKAHGIILLLAKGKDLLYAAPQLDLTDALVAELKAHPIQLPTTQPGE